MAVQAMRPKRGWQPGSLAGAGCAAVASSSPGASRECWIDAEAKNRGERPSRFCVADEHYIPTLLAAAGRENETDCKARAGWRWRQVPCVGAAAPGRRRLCNMHACSQKVRVANWSLRRRWSCVDGAVARADLLVGDCL
jgi:hypothetical protein